MSRYETYFEYLDKCPRGRWIGLQNFQGIRAYTKIPLAPITLLYGQNSAGKSSIHDAFHFINGFFSGEWDHETTTAYLDRWANNKRISHPLNKDYLGVSDDVVIACGGFFNHHELRDYKSQKGIPEDNPDLRTLDYIYNPDNEVLLADHEWPLSIRVHFAHGQIGWYVREFVLYLGEDIFLHYKFYGENAVNSVFGEQILSGDEWYSDSGGFSKSERGPRDYVLHDSCLAFNRKHPAFYELEHGYGFIFSTALKNSSFVGHPIINDNWLILNRLGLLCHQNYDHFTDNPTTPALTWKRIIEWKDYEEDHFDLPEAINQGQQLRSIIDHIISFPVYAIVRDISLFSIPPIREIPTKDKSVYRIGGSSFLSSPFALLARSIRERTLNKIYTSHTKQNELKAPLGDLLSNLLDSIQSDARTTRTQNSKQVTLDHINKALTSPQFLDTDYEIVGDCMFIIPEDVIYKLADISKEELRAILEQLEAEVHLRLRYIPDDLLLEIEDVGVGISQVIPVLLAANSSRVYIQQPELHLHPRLQAQLADIFVEQVNRAPIFVIETHSEHFLLRLLRRIRETYLSDIPHTLFSLKAEDIVVLYVDKTKEGTSNIVQLRLSEEGEFIDRWPNGFFTERDGELFDE